VQCSAVQYSAVQCRDTIPHELERNKPLVDRILSDITYQSADSLVGALHCTALHCSALIERPRTPVWIMCPPTTPRPRWTAGRRSRRRATPTLTTLAPASIRLMARTTGLLHNQSGFISSGSSVIT
jgi:hypothetical protein